MLRGHGCKFHRLLRKAVEAYVEEGVCSKVAQRVGIARSTLYRWIKEPEFLPLYDQLRHRRAAA
jgi:transposase